MPVFTLTEAIEFPPVQLAEPDGMLAIGGDLKQDRLLAAYKKGIFPWYDSAPVLWWCPDPRFVLFPDELKIIKTTQSLLAEEKFEFTVNKAFREVIGQCRRISRPGQQGTWITDEVEVAYTQLHQSGYAHSAEVWENGQLVGGLYGIRLGKVFFGESMFSKISGASRYAFAKYVRLLKAEGVELIDCQVYTAYLESMGARMISRDSFIETLRQLTA